MTWSTVLAVVVLCALGLVLALWMKSKMDRKTVEKQRTEETMGPIRIESKFVSPTEKESLELVRGALDLREPAKAADYFRLGISTQREVVDFLTGLDSGENEVTNIRWLSSMDTNGMLLDGVLVNQVVGGRPRNRLALLTPDESGVWKIDFDAFARVVKPSWEVFQNDESAEGLVRVMVAKDSYFNGVFTDEREWDCFAMESPDTEKLALGYCRKGSPHAQALGKILEKAKDTPATKVVLNRATLEIRRVAGAEARQFEITRVLAEDWVVSDTPFDEKFK